METAVYCVRVSEASNLKKKKKIDIPKWEPNGRLSRISNFESLCLSIPSLPLSLRPRFQSLVVEEKKKKKTMVVAKPKVSYEECRRKRLEENKRRMEALNLPKIAQSLRSSLTPKPSPVISHPHIFSLSISLLYV